MSRPALLWGLGMCVLAAIGPVAFGFGDPRFDALMFGIGGFMVVLGIVLWATGRGESPEVQEHALPDASPPAAWTAGGLVLMACGAVWGLWLVWIGAGVVVVGVGGLLRELRAQRRAQR